MNKKVAVVFHSVCGNTYLMAKMYADEFNRRGFSADIFKVKDENYEKRADEFEASRECKNQILDVKIIEDAEILVDYDYIFLGAPTYYGNVSAAIKTFMDSFSKFYINAPFTNKYFGGFTTAGSINGGANFCLQALNIFAMHMGMRVLSVPFCVGSSAYGLTHFTGEVSLIRPDENIKNTIGKYVENINLLTKG